MYNRKYTHTQILYKKFYIYVYMVHVKILIYIANGFKDNPNNN